MNNWTELIVSIAVAVIPVIGAFVSKRLVGNKQAVSLIQAIEPLAQAAVTAAEQMGVTDQLTGAAKKSGAVQSVMTSLAKLGFTKADEQMVGDAVEKAFADLKTQLHSTYGKDGKNEEDK
ncbi:phage holin [Lacticaseibacillus daqingensis]|uniref:phage holin n=1 Tax=Lacticaseibacillus daqingensis TaxID=2486014 RepID=UPI000F79B8A7|nr:phage holin [Lacticaseibacillus daqingensis]